MKTPIIAAVAMILCLSLSTQSHAVTMTVVDPNSDFSVTYETDNAGLFGTLILSHNTIFFVPDSFIAESNNGIVEGVVSETLSMTLTATTDGFSFDSFFLQETGDYIVDGANTEVSASGEMRVRQMSSLLNEYVDGFDFVTTGDQGIETFNWSGTSEIDESDGWLGTQDQVLLTLQNILTASSQLAGERAFIQKKSVGVAIQVNPVPVPAAVWLFASALGLLLTRRR